MFQDKVLGKYEISNYCNEAKEFTGRNGFCTECPFRDCIYSLKPAEKKMILNAQKIMQVYSYYDQGNNIMTLSKMFKLSYDRIYGWITNRPAVETKIKRLIYDC